MNISLKESFLLGCHYDVLGWQDKYSKLAPYGVLIKCEHDRCNRPATLDTVVGKLCDVCAEAVVVLGVPKSHSALCCGTNPRNEVISKESGVYMVIDTFDDDYIVCSCHCKADCDFLAGVLNKIHQTLSIERQDPLGYRYTTKY